MNPQGILTLIGGCIGILTFLGAAVVYLGGKLRDGTISSFKESVDALELESKVKDRKIESLQKSDAEKDVAIAHLTSEVVTLRTVITNAEEVKAIGLMLADHHTESMKKLSQLERAFVRAGVSVPEAEK